MNTLLYYEICFFLSVALTLVYIYLWHDGIDVNMTCLFILLPIVNLGCIWMFWAPTLEIAILANKIVYLAGCFWPVLATKAILSLCHLKIKKIYTFLAFLLAFAFYFFALMTDRPGPLYKSVTGVIVDGRVELYPEYGWMHTVIYVVMALYVIIGIVALIYAMKNKFRASIRNMWIMFAGEVVTMIVFFIYGMQKLAGSPAILYVLSQVVFLVAGYRSYYYDIDASVMDTLVVEGTLGYITFDRQRRLLGCNQVAEAYFPELKSVRADRPLDNLNGIKKTLSDCIDRVEKNGVPVEVVISCGNHFIRLKVDEYRLRGHKDSYRIIMNDDTDHQNLVRLLSREKDEAEQETKHVSETLHRYVDPNIADKLLRESGAASEMGTERPVAVLFADIRGFTTYSENKSPREVLSLLNRIIEVATTCVMNNNGIVDKIIGDCVMALWFENNESESAALNAAKAALDIQSAMNSLSSEMRSLYGTELELGIGINYGNAIVGNVGTEKRSDYTAIGDAVNVASRVEGIAAPGEILVTDAFASRLSGKASFSPYSTTVRLKGRSTETALLKLEEVFL